MSAEGKRLFLRTGNSEAQRMLAFRAIETPARPSANLPLASINDAAVTCQIRGTDLPRLDS